MVSFFFSSRRRHTRCGRDWSSDVCSSDLFVPPEWASTRRTPPRRLRRVDVEEVSSGSKPTQAVRTAIAAFVGLARSEERRVGKEHDRQSVRRERGRQRESAGGAQAWEAEL